MIKMQKANKRLVPSVPSRVFVGIFTLLIAISRFVDGYPTESLMEKDRSKESLKLDDAFENSEEINYRREEALKKVQTIFGIHGQSANQSDREKIPPQFMMELYNTIADPSGGTRGKNPYNAKIVRSFVERDTRLSHLYLFNISGLEINESVIEAELHLFRKRSVLKVIHPTILRSPYYLIRVYQVLEGQSMHEPDVHRLLNVHYVGAHASGWQVFNVKQAVLAWIAGAPNLGLMVTVSTLFGDEASIEFSRRNEYHNSKQPILVLFDADGSVDEETGDDIHEVPHYYTNNDDEEPELVEKDTNNDRRNIEEEKESVDSELLDSYNSGSSVDRRKRQQDESVIEEPKKAAAVDGNRELNKEIDYGTQLGNNLEVSHTEFFLRYKRIGREPSFGSHQHLSGVPFSFKRENDLVGEARGEENNGKTINRSGNLLRHIRSTNPDDFQRTTNQPDDSLKFATRKKTRLQQVLSSMEIYERAMLRQRIKKKSDTIEIENNRKKVVKAKQEPPNTYEAKKPKRFLREAGEEKETLKSYVDSREANTTKCTRHELYVDFKYVGLSTSIIAPEGYSAFHCQGRCGGTVSHDQQTTNHAIVQEIVRTMGLVREVHMPCCVPTKLLGACILFFDDNDNVVLKVYEDMIADRCGCR